MQSKSTDSIEVIPKRLFWVSDNKPPRGNNKAFFFCIDNDLKYIPFFSDFGPLNLAQTYRFVVELEKLQDNPSFKESPIYHYCSLDTANRANAAYLMGAFQVICLGRTADEAWKMFEHCSPSFVPYRDASYGACTYKCTILDCLRGLEYGIKLGWFNLKKFNLRDYEFYERVENGDLNWTLPGKFVSFSSPSSSRKSPEGYRTFTPEDYIPIFKKMGVTMVIRLNRPQYDKDKFVKAGIKHMDLYFLDGSTPKDSIIKQFLDAVEAEKGAIAIHCKAGQGRTGTLIGMYMMRHYRFPAPDFIGWIRICRPGSILGPQQQYLCEKMEERFMECEKSAIFQGLSAEVKEHTKDWRKWNLGGRLEMTADERDVAHKGQSGQGEHLTGAKGRAK